MSFANSLSLTAFWMQAIQFTQNEYVQLAHKALPLWITLLSAAERAQRGQRDAFPLPLDCAAALMDIAGPRLQDFPCHPINLQKR